MVSDVFVGFGGNGAGVRAKLSVAKALGVVKQARLAFAPEVWVQCKDGGSFVFLPQKRVHVSSFGFKPAGSLAMLVASITALRARF